jgi:transketolase
LGTENENVVVLDAETSNSTYTEKFKKKFPERFFEMFIAEQNMVSTALGLEKQGLIPFVSTFAAFLTRAFDQIRMSQYSYLIETFLSPNLKICGSHAGVSIGADGPSQMGLEDIALFRSLLKSVVFYPADATGSFKLTQVMAKNPGLFYLRTTREKLPVIYPPEEEFKIGGSKILRNPQNSTALVIAAGITVHEALKAADKLAKEGREITVLDLYSVKPVDSATIVKLIKTIKNIIVVEDHYPAGGIAEAVLSSLGQLEISSIRNFVHLCVKKLPRSGTMEELLAYEEINSDAIVKAIKILP